MKFIRTMSEVKSDVLLSLPKYRSKVTFSGGLSMSLMPQRSSTEVSATMVPFRGSMSHTSGLAFASTFTGISMSEKSDLFSDSSTRTVAVVLPVKSPVAFMRKRLSGVMYASTSSEDTVNSHGSFSASTT